VVVTTTTPGGATFPGIWLNYTINLLVSKFKGTSLNITSLLDLLMPVAPKMFLRNTMKVFLRNTTIIRSHRSWTAYPTLTICSWNSNPTTYLETPAGLYYPKTWLPSHIHIILCCNCCRKYHKTYETRSIKYVYI
jgi:hypothetical protein